MQLPKFDRLVARYYVSGSLGVATSGDLEVLVEHAEDDPLSRTVLLVVEHARLSGASLNEIRETLVAWFSDTSLRLWWIPEREGPLITGVDFDPLGAAVWVTFTECLVSEDIIEDSLRDDPEWHGGEEAWAEAAAVSPPDR